MEDLPSREFMHAKAPLDGLLPPATRLLTHQEWTDLQEYYAKTAAGKWRAHCADAVARISWNGLIWKRSRVELGLLILDGLRTRHARDQMVRAMGVSQGDGRS